MACWFDFARKPKRQNMKKITLTLRLDPYDALEVISMLNKKKAISDRVYIKKIDSIMASIPLMQRLAEKE